MHIQVWPHIFVSPSADPRRVAVSYWQILARSVAAGAPEAQWVKHWPTDLAVMSMSPA